MRLLRAKSARQCSTNERRGASTKQSKQNHTLRGTHARRGASTKNYLLYVAVSSLYHPLFSYAASIGFRKKQPSDLGRPILSMILGTVVLTELLLRGLHTINKKCEYEVYKIASRPRSAVVTDDRLDWCLLAPFNDFGRAHFFLAGACCVTT